MLAQVGEEKPRACGGHAEGGTPILQALPVPILSRVSGVSPALYPFCPLQVVGVIISPIPR